MDKQELEKLMQLIAEAYRKAGREIQEATLVTNLHEDGSLEGEELINNTNKEVH